MAILMHPKTSLSYKANKTEAFDLIKQLTLAKRFIPDLLVPQMADKNALTQILFEGYFDIETSGLSKIQTTLSIDGQSIDIDMDINQPQNKLNTVVSGKRLNLDAYKTKASANANNLCYLHHWLSLWLYGMVKVSLSST